MKKYGGRPHWAKVPMTMLLWGDRVYRGVSLPLFHHGSSWRGVLQLSEGQKRSPASDWSQGRWMPRGNGIPDDATHPGLVDKGSHHFCRGLTQHVVGWSRASDGHPSQTLFLLQAHSCTRKDFEKMYPAFSKFCSVREKLDPTGIFLNAYLEKVFY